MQEKLDHIQIKVVTNGQSFDQSGLVSQVKEACGEDVQVDIVMCDHIAPTASGKFLFTISKVV